MAIIAAEKLCRKCGKTKNIKHFSYSYKSKDGYRHVCNDCIYPNPYSKHRLFKVFDSIKQRCLNPNSKNYSRYGGRGVGVCHEWVKNPKIFIDYILENLGDRPTENHTLDRIDNNKGYEPGNLRWATKIEQSQNTRKTIYIEYQGETKTLHDWAEYSGIPKRKLINRFYYYKDLDLVFLAPSRLIEIKGKFKSIFAWCKEYGKNPSTVFQRIKRGWDPVEAIITPPKKKSGLL
jgi:hypothetical protein